MCTCVPTGDTARASWDEWWTYDGISGPDFWGLLNPDWHLCSRGRAQSPIDLDPQQLLFDPRLKPFVFRAKPVEATLINTGHVIFISLPESSSLVPTISGGPLQYTYAIAGLHIHHGQEDWNGSEHTIAGHAYPAELQMLGYNSDLFANLTAAFESREGSALVALSVMLRVGSSSHSEFRLITNQLSKVIYRDQKAQIERLDVSRLLPPTEEYMTYTGSLSQPNCLESVRWLVMNKAIQVSRQQINLLRKLMQGDKQNPKAPLWNNRRPLQPLNNRIVHTNIDFKRSRNVEVRPSEHEHNSYTGLFPR
ncbi:putative carbonic anhydrase protein 1-like [Tropilaelaps mercedesae]|uniref:Putative carbonic anhydrase protein 1-like n=1 Tax=Tropilaelaps mercedesae TaxID=418985 RepID=A0A1V9XRZ4_9ACAR|nr:putative carbonic anhydrase protein 1-like [Tropilaelaps mercedesae]